MTTSLSFLSGLLPAFLGMVLLAPHRLQETGSEAASASSLPPNIVFILLDDIGWGDVGFHGGTYPTPRLDALREDSLDLRCHYAMHSCSPARMAFLTGRYPVRFGAFGTGGPIRPNDDRGIPTTEVLLPKRLKQAGYATALVGKWHVGHHLPEHRPLQRGFDSFVGSYHNLSSYTERVYRDGRPGWYRGEKLESAEGHTTDIIANEAVSILENADADQPLFLQVAFTAMHRPHQPRAEDLARFEALATEGERNFAALLFHLDQAVGRIADAIDRSVRSQETLLVITSDNGGEFSAFSTNAPFRGAKGQPNEGGIRTVALCRWPGAFEPGAVDQVISIVDWYPTFASLAGLAPAVEGVPSRLDGIDVFERLIGEKAEARGDLLLMATDHVRALRRGDWKLISHKDGRVRLFDVERDASEENELSGDESHAALIASMKEAAWSYRADAK